MEADLHANEMSALAHFYMENYLLAEDLILQGMGGGDPQLRQLFCIGSPYTEWQTYV